MCPQKISQGSALQTFCSRCCGPPRCQSPGPQFYCQSAPVGWHTVNDLIAKETLKMVYKCTNDEPPSYLACLLGRLSETITRELRNTESDLRVPFLRTTCGQKCFSFRGAKLWNGLDTKSKLVKISNNFSPVSKTPENKGNLFIPAIREQLTTFTLLFHLLYGKFFKGLSFFFVQGSL